MTSNVSHEEDSAHVVKQRIKWIVYILLVINFFYYIYDDWTAASHTLREGGTLFEWANAFATSIDEVGWFVLLALFELETYVLSDEVFKGLVKWTIHIVRLLCYLFLAHTIFAYAANVADLHPAPQVPKTTSLCQLANTNISFTRNIEYDLIEDTNCATLSADNEFYFIETKSVVTDNYGLRIQRELAWVDLVEAFIWLLIVFTIEYVVWLQTRGVTGGLLISVNNGIKIVLYGLLFVAAGYWFFRTHWWYVWDELVWIGGFAAIEMNVVEWRNEIVEEDALATASAVQT